ncbi:MAG: phosphatidylglycerophosphatase A [bacterium]|nr:MAG: phosphatidylglycerophosphatase A [bacterium]
MNQIKRTQAILKGHWKDQIVLFFATTAYAGYIPYAPGTFATLVIAVPLYLAFALLPAPFYLYALFIFFWLACYLAHKAESILQEKDSSRIVIDEAVGYLTALACLPNNWLIILLAFVLFRFFDILKIYPVNLIENKVPGGLGVVLDDFMAGVYANICLQVLIALWPAIQLI